MNRIKILCIFIIIIGIALFLSSYLFISPTSPIFRWNMGLSCGLIILGLGYLINVLLTLYGEKLQNQPDFFIKEQIRTTIKEKSGYLVCKIMNILLCIYLLVLNELSSPPLVMILGIILLLLQFSLDLIFQIYCMRHKEEEE